MMNIEKPTDLYIGDILINDVTEDEFQIISFTYKGVVVQDIADRDCTNILLSLDDLNKSYTSMSQKLGVRISDKKKTFGGRRYSEETISKDDIRPGDVVVEDKKKYAYRVLTSADGDRWEYFDDDDRTFEYTGPEYCSYLVKGQPNTESGILIKII